MKYLITFTIFLLMSTLLIANPGVKDFTLKDYNNKEHKLSAYADSEAIVLIFVSTKCPVSNAYNSRMAAISDAYSNKQVAFLGINSNKTESVEEIKSHSLEHNFSFAVLKDNNNVIADQFDAKYTPEVFVLNKSLEVIYHGRIDDSRREGEVESHDLKATLDAILAGSEIPNKTTKAFGCSIKRVDK